MPFDRVGSITSRKRPVPTRTGSRPRFCLHDPIHLYFRLSALKGSHHETEQLAGVSLPPSFHSNISRTPPTRYRGLVFSISVNESFIHKPHGPPVVDRPMVRVHQPDIQRRAISNPPALFGRPVFWPQSRPFVVPIPWQ